MYRICIFAVLFIGLLKNLTAIEIIKTIASSVEKPELAAEFAVDNNMNTRWSSAFEDNQFIQFEFSKIELLTGMKIVWETAAALKYSVKLSKNKKQWITLTNVTDGEMGEIRAFNFEKPIPAKFVKIECEERATEWGFSIIEVEFNTDPDKKFKTERKETIQTLKYKEGDSFFKIIKTNGVFWFKSPEGKLFISKGINCVVPKDNSVKPGALGYDVTKKYLNLRDWVSDAINRIKGWEFNSIGCWSDENTFISNVPFFVILNISVPGHTHRLCDVWNPKFESNLDKMAKKRCESLKNAKYLVGYFLDNELPWYGDFGWFTGHPSYLLDIYMTLPSDAEGKKVLVNFFKARYKKISEFNKVWQTKFSSFDKILTATKEEMTSHSKMADEDREIFSGLVAERFYKVITETIKKYDPNHLILGSRFAGGAPKSVVENCGKYCDVISVNYYTPSMIIKKSDFDRIHVFSGYKPLLVTEFSYRAMENNSGNKNTRGAPVTVPLQKDRADGFEKYVNQAMSFPYCVGYHWFQYADQSPEGRTFDGEDCNWGIVDIYDKEYPLLVSRMKTINPTVEEKHKRSGVYEISTNLTTEGGHASVEIDESVTKKIPGLLFCDFSKNFNIITWQDSAAGANINWKKIIKKDTETILITSKAEGWGCGLTFIPTMTEKNSDGSVNLKGYSGISVTISANKELKFMIFINESGVAAPGAGSYNGVNGADGESFTSAEFICNEKEKNFDIDFSSLRVRTEWGNQSGNKTVNLGGIASIDIFFPSGSSGEVFVKKISLK